MKRTYRGSDPAVGRKGPDKHGGAFGTRAMRKRVAEFEKKNTAGELTPAESVALHRFKQVLPPDRDVELRRALGLNKEEM